MLAIDTWDGSGALLGRTTAETAALRERRYLSIVRARSLNIRMSMLYKKLPLL
jgi:hypothetical protein